jgi:hypothetical protein
MIIKKAKKTIDQTCVLAHPVEAVAEQPAR